MISTSAPRIPSRLPFFYGWVLVAVAIVAQAVMGMARSLCPDRARASIATIALIVMLAAPWPLLQIGTIVVGGIAGWMLCRGEADTTPDNITMPVSRKLGIACLTVFFVVLAVACVPGISLTEPDPRIVVRPCRAKMSCGVAEAARAIMSRTAGS